MFPNKRKGLYMIIQYVETSTVLELIIEKNFFVWKCDLHTTTEMKWRMYAGPSSNRYNLLSKQLQYKNSSRKGESE